MSLNLQIVKRCEHIKDNGAQCNSPALRDAKFCYFHIQYHCPQMGALPSSGQWRMSASETVRDAKAIQLALAKVMECLQRGTIDHKAAGQILHALRTASTNLGQISKLERRTRAVLNRELNRQPVANRPFDASVWSRIERKYDDQSIDEPTEKTGSKQPPNPKRLQ